MTTSGFFLILPLACFRLVVFLSSKPYSRVSACIYAIKIMPAVPPLPPPLPHGGGVVIPTPRD